MQSFFGRLLTSTITDDQFINAVTKGNVDVVKKFLTTHKNNNSAPVQQIKNEALRLVVQALSQPDLDESNETHQAYQKVQTQPDIERANEIRGFLPRIQKWLQTRLDESLTTIMDLLIQNNADVNQTDARGTPLLCIAAENGNINAVFALVKGHENNKADVFLTDKSGCTSLMATAKSKHYTQQMNVQIYENGCSASDPTRSGHALASKHDSKNRHAYFYMVEGIIDRLEALRKFGFDIEECFLNALHRKTSCDEVIVNHIDAIRLFRGSKDELSPVLDCAKNYPQLRAFLANLQQDEIQLHASRQPEKAKASSKPKLATATDIYVALKTLPAAETDIPATPASSATMTAATITSSVSTRAPSADNMSEYAAQTPRP